MTDLDYGTFEALTFDCYGTLIDWETGILAALRRVLAAHGVDAADDELLEAYAAIEAPAEAGPYQTYRAILAAGVRGVAAGHGVEPSRVCTGDFGWASSPTAMTTCSHGPRRASAWTSTGS